MSFDLKDLVGRTVTIQVHMYGKPGYGETKMAPPLAEGAKVIDDVSYTVHKGKLLGNHKKPSSDLEEESVLSKSKMK